MTEPPETRLAAALKVHAAEPWTGDPAEGWRQLTRLVFADAGIELTPEQFDRAWRAGWKCGHMGGNYTLDARRILAAVHAEGDEA